MNRIANRQATRHGNRWPWGVGMLAVLICGALMMACVPSYISDALDWSPNGRFLAFIHPKTQELWLWDTQRQQAQLLVEQKVNYCHFAPDGTLYFMQESQNANAPGKYELDRIHFGAAADGSLEKSKVDAGLAYTDTEKGGAQFSRDGKRLYFTQPMAKGSDRTGFFEAELTSTGLGARRMLFSTAEPLGRPAPAPDGRSVLYASNGTIVARDLAAQTTRSLVAGAKDQDVNDCPTWLDGTHFIYAHHHEKPDSDTLVAYSLDDRTTRTLLEKLQPAAPIVLPDGKILAVATMPGDFDIGFGQAVTIDPKARKVDRLTDMLPGVAVGALDAGGDAYAAMSADSQTVLYRTLKGGRTVTVWTDDEERMYATGATLADAGATAQAVATWKQMQARYPDSDLAKWAMARAAIAAATATPPDLDGAYELTRQPGDLGQFAGAVFLCMWPPASRLATDPAGDWTRTYATDASRREYGFDSDATRDLIALSGRLSPQYLFLRIDYASSRDLDGLTFQDTELLFDYDSPGDGDRAVTPLVQWDRGAERRVLIHCWHDAKEQSLYNVEMFNEKGERASHYDASGFAGAQYPDVNAAPVSGDSDSSGSLVVVLSREALGLKPGMTAYLQVCTMKGGIEDAKGLERPRETNMAKSQAQTPGDQALCDVADAFGDANTAARIDADLHAGKRAIIQGYAAKIEAPPGASTK